MTNPLKEENINYWQEFVTSQTSIMGLAGAIGLGAVLSVPFGLGFAIIPPLLFCSGGFVASMFIPSSPLYQEYVRRKKRKERLLRLEAEMIESIQQKVPEQDLRWMEYWKIKEQTDTIKRWNKEGLSMSQYEIDAFEESVLSYLRMWCSLLAMKESIQGIQIYDIKQKITQIEHQLGQTTGDINQKQLQQAIVEYQKILDRHHDLNTRIISMEAKMVSLKHTVEEIHQRLISGQISSSVDIQDALGQLRLEEEIDLAMDWELHKTSVPSTEKKKQKSKAKQQREI